MEDGRTPELRRMMVEYGEQFWKQGWAPLYGVLGGNPLAAMPSLHFATSVTAAHVLSDTGQVAGAFGWAYAATLGLALVYLGEHYVVDLAAGLALAETIQRVQPRLTPASRALTKRPSRYRGQGAGTGMTRRRSRRSTCRLPAMTEDDDDRGLDLNGRTILMLCGFLAAMIAGALPAAAAARGPRGHLEPDRGRLAGLDRARVRAARSACSPATWRCSAGVFGHVERIGWRESYLITMAALAASRIFAAGGAGGLVLQAWALRQAGMASARSPTRRSASSS